MKDEEKPDLERLKFHWDVWTHEASRFWRHITFGTIGLVAMNLFQLDVLKIDFTHTTLTLGANSLIIKRWLICPVSLWLWISILFGVVDFLRHRVPEKYEHLIHNNSYPVPFRGKKPPLDLKPIARVLYLFVVLLYLAILGGWVIYASIKAWM